MTQQQYAKKADINNIVASAFSTGMPPQTNFGLIAKRPAQPFYGDVSSIDHQTRINAVQDMHAQFGGLPARIRSRFRNDPVTLMRWLENPDNREEAVKLGLLVEKPETYQEASKKAEKEAEQEAKKADDEANPDYKKKPSKKAELANGTITPSM